MLKFIFYILLFLLPFSSYSQALAVVPPPTPMVYENEPNAEEFKLPDSAINYAGTNSTLSNTLAFLSNPLLKTAPVKASGEWGLNNLQIHGGLTLTSFDDSSDTVNSSGHYRDYGLSMSFDLTENDFIMFGVSKSRYETGGVNGILSRTKGTNFVWLHNLSENYSVGVIGFLNDVDIEEVNGNTFSYGYGLLFTTYHSFEYFDISTATTLAHTDFDIGYDQLFMTSLTLSRKITDKLGTYLTLTYTDSLKADPDADPTYGSWEIGVNYQINDNLNLSTGFSRTEFLNNYSDNTLHFNASWSF